jgi:sigma-E factor negative regulatory protein RseC
MIEEEAYVADIADGQVWIEKSRGSACSGCAESCPSAVAGGLFGDKRVRMKLACDLPLRPGDKVLVGVDEAALAGASLRIYLLPLLGLFAGALLGQSVAGSDLASALGGLLGLGFSLAGLRFFRLFGRNGCGPVILRKID